MNRVRVDRVSPAVRVRAVRWGLWGLVAAAVVAGTASWLSGGAASDPAPAAVADVAAPPAAVGVAERAAVHWTTAESSSIEVVAASAVASRPVGDGWSLTVAVDVEEIVDEEPVSSVWWVQVVVDAAGRLVGGPAVVPAPVLVGQFDAPSGLSAPDEGDPVAATVSGLLAALLAGEGTPDPYLVSPEAVVVAEPPFVTATVERLGAVEQPDGSLRVSAEVDAVTAGGVRLSVFYELVLVASGDRWLVGSLAAPSGWGAQLDLAEPLPAGSEPAVSFSSAPGA